MFTKNHKEPPKVAQLAKKKLPNLVTLEILDEGQTLEVIYSRRRRQRKIVLKHLHQDGEQSHSLHSVNLGCLQFKFVGMGQQFFF